MLRGSEVRADLRGQDWDLDLTIVIVSYNTREMTLACISSVFNQTFDVTYEMILVDNGSADGSVDAIRAQFPSIKVIASRENLGFARANNLAVSRGRGRRILMLNPDTLILDRGIDRLHEFATIHPKCRIWGGRTLFGDGRLNPLSCHRRMTLWNVFCTAIGLNQLKGSRVFNSEAYGGWKRDSVRAVDIVSGCFLLVDRDLWEHLNGLDTTFFMYGEEADLCLRARKYGAKPMITPAATIIHFGGASGVNKCEQRMKLFAGKITLMKRHWSVSACVLGKYLYLLLVLTRRSCHTILYELFNDADCKREAQNWQTIWRNRKNWINGWVEDGK